MPFLAFGSWTLLKRSKLAERSQHACIHQPLSALGCGWDVTAASMPSRLDFPTRMDCHLELGATVDAFFSKMAEETETRRVLFVCGCGMGG